MAAGSSREEAALIADLQSLEAQFRAPGATMAQKMEAGKGIIEVNARVVATFDAATAQSLFALFKRNMTWQTPTLTLLQAQIDEPLEASDPRGKWSVTDRWMAPASRATH